MEHKSGRKILRVLKNRISKDVMYVMTGKMNKVSVQYNELDPREDYDQYNPTHVSSAYELLDYDWEKTIDPVDMDDDEVEELQYVTPTIDVSVAIIVDPGISDYNIAGYSGTPSGSPGIDIMIELPNGFPKHRYSELRSELGNVVLHELEHLTQDGDRRSFNRGEEYYDVNIPPGATSEYVVGYLLNPKEISAHVIGYSDAASSFSDFEDRARKDLETYSSLGKMKKQEIPIVFFAWADWARKNLNQKRFKQ
jgi:hypothetical protein